MKEPVSTGSWTAWFEIPWIEYGEENSFSNEIHFEEYDEKKKNNLGLVQWAIQAHENGWGYVYGTYGKRADGIAFCRTEPLCSAAKLQITWNSSVRTGLERGAPTV